MKSEDEIEFELRYWNGRLKGLTESGRAPQDKITEAKTWAKTLSWVLAKPTGEGSKGGGKVT